MLSADTTSTSALGARPRVGWGTDPVSALLWEDFAADWALQTAEARSAAQALREGRVLPALERCLSGHPALRAAGLRALRSVADGPALGDLDAPPPQNRRWSASPFEHRVALYERQSGPHGGLAWTLRELGLLAARTDELERQGWAEPAPTDPLRDLQTATCWAAWASGSLWPQYGTFSRLFLPAAREAFLAVFASRAVPVHAQQTALAELPHVFATVMLSEQQALPGILDVALRIVEHDAAGPLVALARQLPPEAWRQTLGCLAGRGTWARTWREIGEGGQPPATDAVFLDEAVSLHSTLRLLRLWAEGNTHPRLSWRVLRQNRGKVRGRLRALLAETLGRKVGGLLLEREGLYAQTRAAISAFSLSWAWHELRAGLPMNPDNAITPRCEPPDPALAPLDEAQETALRTWVLLVLLRGRLGHLQTWVETGRQPDQDTVFGRLLADELPVALVDPTSTGPRRGYRRVRDALGGSLPELLSALLPCLHALAVLPPGRTLKRRFEELLAPGWHESVRFPERDFADMQAHAAAALRAPGPTEEDPWNL